MNEGKTFGLEILMVQHVGNTAIRNVQSNKNVKFSILLNCPEKHLTAP